MGRALCQGSKVASGAGGTGDWEGKDSFLGLVEPAGDVGLGEPCRVRQVERAQCSLGDSEMEW